jgi:hypothetical protein
MLQQDSMAMSRSDAPARVSASRDVRARLLAVAALIFVMATVGAAVAHWRATGMGRSAETAR